MKSKGIVGTDSPLILTASVTFSNGVSGLVYVGQSVVSCMLAIKSTFERMTTIEGSAPNVWQVGVWDTRDPDKGYTVLDWEGGDVPTLTDVKHVSAGMDGYLSGILS